MYQFEPEVYIIKKFSPGERTGFRSIRLQIFFRLGVLKNFVNSTEKQLCWSLFLIKLQPFMSATFSKIDSSAGAFCEYCRNF